MPRISNYDRRAIKGWLTRQREYGPGENEFVVVRLTDFEIRVIIDALEQAIDNT